MSKIFKNQTYLRIILATGVDISEAIKLQIEYLKPDKSNGFIDADLYDESDADPNNGKIVYAVPPGIPLFDQSGAWRIWAYITFPDGRIARGESVPIEIYDDNV